MNAVSSGTRTPDAAVAVLFTAARINTWLGTRGLTSASGFFFRRGRRLFLVTNRHVFVDVPAKHFPDRVEIILHTDCSDLTRHVLFTLPLYANGLGLWRQASDTGGSVDIAALEVDSARLPTGTVLQAFDAASLAPGAENVSVGDTLTVIGFPLGFHDTVHHLAVARSASVASAYGVRFQQQGYFLTDARTHRGSSGSAVLRRRRHAHHSDISLQSWQLLGVHSTRIGMQPQTPEEDESLGLNCAWYADVLETLTR